MNVWTDEFFKTFSYSLLCLFSQGTDRETCRAVILLEIKSYCHRIKSWLTRLNLPTPLIENNAALCLCLTTEFSFRQVRQFLLIALNSNHTLSPFHCFLLLLLREVTINGLTYPQPSSCPPFPLHNSAFLSLGTGCGSFLHTLCLILIHSSVTFI